MSVRVVVTSPVGDDAMTAIASELAGIAEVAMAPAPDDPIRGDPATRDPANRDPATRDPATRDPGRAEVLSGATAMICWNPDRELSAHDWANATRVRFLQTLSAGLDHVGFDRIPPGVTVAGNSGAYAAPIAEHAVAMVLALAKRLLPAHAELAAGTFDQSAQSRSLAGLDAVILGYGGIGRAVARLLRPFGVRVVGVNRSGNGDEAADQMLRVADLEAALRQADILVVSLPLTRATAELIGARELEWMRRDAILVNVARGEIIDQDALYSLLVAEPTFLAGIDAWWVEPFRHGRFELAHPFLKLPNVLGSPHNSASVPGAITEGARCAAANVARFLRMEQPLGVAGPDDRFRG